MKHLLVVLYALVVVAGTSAAAIAQDQPATQADTTLPDREIIRQNVELYVKAYNAKDAKKLASFWSPDGVYIDQLTGEQISGRDRLEQVFAKNFEATKDAKLEVRVIAVEFVSPSVAVEQGEALMTAPEADPVVTKYSAVHVKAGGTWLIDRISEKEVFVPPSHYEQLKQLEWMIGNWGDQHGAGTVEMQCHWSRNNNFIVRGFTVALDEEIDMAGIQIIGWDAAQERIRSWTFDSDGGFNEGIWSKTDERWNIRVVATLPDGRRASATAIMEELDENSFRFQQVDRIVGGELLPNIPQMVITRKVDSRSRSLVPEVSITPGPATDN